MCLSVVCLLVLMLCGIQNVFGTNSSNEYVSGELIVSFVMDDSISSFSENSSIESQEDSLRLLGLDIKDSMIKSISADKNNIMMFKDMHKMTQNFGSVFLVKYNKPYFSIKYTANKIKRKLEQQGYNIKYVEPNSVVKALDCEKSSYTLNPNQAWHYNMIKVPQAWDTTIGSSNVKIAVVDSGIDYNHNCLSNFVDVNSSKSYVEGNTSPMDDHCHGTHVAGTIASYGSVSGVMRNATLIAVKVLNNKGSGTSYAVQQGITYAAQQNADVINLSLGGGSYSQAMQDACTYAINNGTVVVAATGNNYSSTVSYPAKYEGVIGVGNVKSDGTRSASSQYGEGLDISAPGTNIYSTVPNNQFATYSGTSMATPHVAGVVGLMRSVKSDATVQEICDTIFNTAQPKNDMTHYGYGIIDAEACVLNINGNPNPPGEDELDVDVSFSSYFFGIYLKQTVTVKDQDNSLISGANVKFEVTCPDGYVENETTTTNSSGIATNTTSKWSHGSGKYTVKVTVEKAGYDTVVVTKSVNFN